MSNLLIVLRHADGFVVLLGSLWRARFAGALGALLRAGAQKWLDVLHEQRRRTRERAMLRECSSLSDATLHDLGLARCELRSYHAELSGRAEPTRLRVMHDPLRHEVGAGLFGPRP